MPLRTSREMTSFIEDIKSALDDIAERYNEFRTRDLTANRVAYTKDVFIANSMKLIWDILLNVVLILNGEE